jgi:hypothetical protein
MRCDFAFGVSTLQAERGGDGPTVSSLLRANALLAEMKKVQSWPLQFHDVDPYTCCLVAISDAALGNVTERGTVGAGEKVRSQAGFLIFLADASLVAGDRGRMSLLDFKSFGLRRICRSSYVAETYAVEEVLDMVLVCRGMMKEVTGREPPVVCVVDARDTYDRCTVDTKPSHGAVKSLAYTVAGLRQVLRLPGVSLKWTHTENMLADALTKDSRELAQHLRSTLSRGEWAVKYVPGLTKACKRDAVRAQLSRQDSSSEAASVAATTSTTARRRLRR